MKNLFVILCMISWSMFYGQQAKIDSLLNVVETTKIDTQKVLAQADLASIYSKTNDSTNFIKTFNSAYELAKKVKFYRGEILLLIRESNYYTNNYDREKSIDALKTAESIALKQKESTSLGKVYYQYSIYYKWQDDFSSSLNYSYKALKIFESNKDNLNTAFCYSQIGNLYRKQKSYDKAKDYFTKSYLLDSTNNIIENLGVDLTNLGLVYSDLKEYEKSVYYLEKSLEFKKKLGNKRGVVNSLNLLGATYIDWGKPNLAIQKLNEALELSKSINDNKGIVNSLINLGASYQAIKDYKKAIAYLSECIEHSKKIGNFDILIDAYRVISESYAATNNTEKAYQMHLLYTGLKDSIYNSESQKLMIDMQTKYDSEKKENENKLLQAENLLSASTIKQQKITSYFIIGGLVLALLLAYFVFRGLKQQRKANSIISQQKLLVEEKHKEITDSINYAERIQKSFLATEELLNENLKNYFVLFLPKDVVSGDFYWAASTLQPFDPSRTSGLRAQGSATQKLFYLVTADSTGHGVPGAIMSILNISSLEKAIEAGLNEPAEIFNHTRKTIIDRLKKDGSKEGGKDGMDASILCFDFEKLEMKYAAANNPVWIIRKNELIELAPDKMPVGKHDKDTTPFSQKEMQLESGDLVYTLTDGMPDQFGGPKGKKFMYKQLKELLISNASLEMEMQKKLLLEALNNWKKNLEQVDDITLIGIRIS